MYKIINFNEKEKWDEIVKSFENNDVYFLWGYINSFKINGDGKPELFYFENENGRVINIFFKRDISKCESFIGKIEENKFFDIATPYGYGGPIFEGENIENLINSYTQVFNEYCKKSNIISEFIRFNPMIENEKNKLNGYEIINIRETVYMDLSKGEEYIWSDLIGKKRTNIRKALKNNIEIKYGNNKDYINDFVQLYKRTMEKDNAVEYYYFSDEFFYETLENLKDNLLIFVAEFEEKIIAATMILYNDKFVHYHLSGSDENFSRLSANNLMLYEVAKWGVENEKKLFHLGGGYSSSDDSLFKYKSEFSKENRFDFCIGKKVHNQDEYNNLVEIREKNSRIPDGFFPKYRA